MAVDFASGTWELEKSENFDEYMIAVGVGFAWRKMGNAAKPKQEITIKDGVWTVNTSTLLTKSSIQFELNKEFNETTADGRECKSICNVEGNKLITKQTGPIDSLIVRDFRKDSFVMVHWGIWLLRAYTAPVLGRLSQRTA